MSATSTRRNSRNNPSANGTNPDNRVVEILNGPGFGNGPVVPGILSGDETPANPETPPAGDSPAETPVSPPADTLAGTDSPETGPVGLNPDDFRPGEIPAKSTPKTPRNLSPDRNDFSPADVANLTAIGFVPAGGGYYSPAEPDGSFFGIERVVNGGRFYLIRYVRPAGCPVPKPLYRTEFNPVFYPR